MKKILSLFVVALLCRATPAYCAPTRADTVKDVESCWAVLQEIMSDPSTAIPKPILQAAHAIVIVKQFKAGYIFGFKGGYGVFLAKKPDGTWSVPVLLSANEASLGLQIGFKSVESVYVVTDDATPKLLFRDRFNVGVDAKAVAGPAQAIAEKDYVNVLKNPVIIYTKSLGLFAGATVKAGLLARNDAANFILYNSTYTLPELLYGNWVTPPEEVKPLMKYVSDLTR